VQKGGPGCQRRRRQGGQNRGLAHQDQSIGAVFRDEDRVAAVGHDDSSLFRSSISRENDYGPPQAASVDVERGCPASWPAPGVTVSGGLGTSGGVAPSWSATPFPRRPIFNSYDMAFMTASAETSGTAIPIRVRHAFSSGLRPVILIHSRFAGVRYGKANVPVSRSWGTLLR
jgi:hypothetical protein